LHQHLSPKRSQLPIELDDFGQRIIVNKQSLSRSRFHKHDTAAKTA
jgi:hypothetical protein